jgi:hypothetical protein
LAKKIASLTSGVGNAKYPHVEEGNFIPIFLPVEKNSPVVKRL